MVDSFTSIISLVKNDVGIAVIPDHLIKKEDQLKVQEIPGLPSSQIYMSTLNYKKMPERIKHLSDIVKKSRPKKQSLRTVLYRNETHETLNAAILSSAYII